MINVVDYDSFCSPEKVDKSCVSPEVTNNERGSWILDRFSFLYLCKHKDCVWIFIVATLTRNPRLFCSDKVKITGGVSMPSRCLFIACKEPVINITLWFFYSLIKTVLSVSFYMAVAANFQSINFGSVHVGRKLLQNFSPKADDDGKKILRFIHDTNQEDVEYRTGQLPYREIAKRWHLNGAGERRTQKILAVRYIHNCYEGGGGLPNVWWKILSKFTSFFFSKYLCITLLTLEQKFIKVNHKCNKCNSIGIKASRHRNKER